MGRCNFAIISQRNSSLGNPTRKDSPPYSDGPRWLSRTAVAGLGIKLVEGTATPAAPWGVQRIGSLGYLYKHHSPAKPSPQSYLLNFTLLSGIVVMYVCFG